MAERYPAVEPYESGMLGVTDGHRLYWEMCGASDGTAAVYLHGGPGSGCTPGARRSFDPRSYRAVLFDQRGCGRSRPLASDGDADLSTNTTPHLIGDIERLREHLGIDRWVVVGAVPAAQRGGDLPAAYARLLADPDPQMRAQAARQWCAWEDTHMSLTPGWAPSLSYRDPEFQLTFARLVTHYWSQGCFLEEGQILAHMHRLADIPAVLIHGRYDVSGPMDTAWHLHRAWPNSKLVVLDDAGHGGGSFISELVGALDSFRALR